MTSEELFDLDDIPEFADEDASGAGHRELAYERQIVHYLRLIDGEMQHLKAFRQAYNPPPKRFPLVARSISYGNEEHPAARKRTITIPVSQLPLSNDAALHKLILLAGVRWTPVPPKDSGMNVAVQEAEKGFIKISCERFPEAGMNIKWACDALDKLVREANKTGDNVFPDIPLDFRHLSARRLKQKRGEHRSGTFGKKPTLKDFPVEWLPDSAQEMR